MDPETSSGVQFVLLLLSFRIHFGIFFLLLASLQRILKQVQDDERWGKFFSSWLTLLFLWEGKAPRKLSPSMVGENENL